MSGAVLLISLYAEKYNDNKGIQFNSNSIMGRISRQSVLIHQHSFTDDPALTQNPG